MKKVLGLDLGVASIGWALVQQADNKEEKSSIIKAGVRIVPLDRNEKDNFEQGKPCETNVDRRRYRTMRRNIKRYQMRRSNLKQVLKDAGWIDDNTILAEHTNASTFETYRLRSEAVNGPVSLEEFARVLLMINKKRGYKSNRKTMSADDGLPTDGMDVAMELYRSGLTPGEYALNIIKAGKKSLPDFYRSDLKNEFNRIWDAQKSFFPELLTDEFKEQVEGRGRNDVAKIFGKKGITTADNKGAARRLQSFQWRADALRQKLSPEVLAYVLADVSGAIHNSSGHLGKISDHSKELAISGKTIGQYLYEHIQADSHFCMSNLIFYRADYIKEFETLWAEQSKFHSELTPELEKKIKNEIIFYQRRLKSQKGLISLCPFESRMVKTVVDGKEKTVLHGPRVAPRSSLVFQEFKLWQILNNVKFTDKETGEVRPFSQSEKETLAKELLISDKMTSSEAFKILFRGDKSKETKFDNLEGNSTYAAFVRKYMDIVNRLNDSEYNVSKMRAEDAIHIINTTFEANHFEKGLLDFDPLLPKEQFEQQKIFKLWHLLYSFEGDDSTTGDENLVQKISEITGMPATLSRMIAGITFKNDDYASLSNKAMLKILPYLKEGHLYSEACALAGYNHSPHSMTNEQLDAKELVNTIPVLAKGSLRNPIVEKILNQMIHVVNAVGEEYGKPDEIHVEFSRELKNNQKKREDAYRNIIRNEDRNNTIRTILKDEFSFRNVRNSDILRYKLWEELKDNGYKTLYSNKYIPREKIFSNEIDIEHIIPQSVYFDDSFNNKTLEYKDVNIKKGNATARDFVEAEYGKEHLEEYVATVNRLYWSREYGKKKRYLLMSSDQIPTDFLNRDLSNSQYIAKKATEILESYVRTVMPTTGSVTSRLREDWQLVDVMKEINLPKYREVGLTHMVCDENGRETEKIDNDWTKRNDHRHHAMDALTIAFTKPSHIQYLNNLAARSNRSSSIYGIMQNETLVNGKGKRIFVPPMPLNELRAEFRHQLDSALVSIKAKNKVVTRNVNKTKKKGGFNTSVELTPRGQMHKEQVYGSRTVYETFFSPVGSKMDAEAIKSVASKREREALARRLNEFGGDPKKAFTGANSPEKNPIWTDEAHTQKLDSKVKCVRLQQVYSIRKDITPNLSINKVMDTRVRAILNARLEEYGGNANAAFSGLDENPIWLNKEKGISIKKVTIAENFDLCAIRTKHDNLGNVICDENGNPVASDYVNLRNNHHVAIFQLPDGKYEERVVSFYEALDRVSLGLPAVDKDYRRSEGWKFMFSMKINEMFVFPNEKTGFDPHEIYLTDPANYAAISPNLFRVQKLSSGLYYFRHHQDTSTDFPNELRDITWKRITNLPEMSKCVKVRINHLGQIVAVGEYD